MAFIAREKIATAKKFIFVIIAIALSLAIIVLLAVPANSQHKTNNLTSKNNNNNNDANNTGSNSDNNENINVFINSSVLITTNLPIVVMRMNSTTPIDPEIMVEYNTAHLEIFGTINGNNSF